MFKKKIIWLLKVLSISAALLIIVIVCIGGGFGEKNRDSIIDSETPMIFAHRGIPYYAENSIESFVNCNKLGFNAVEIDVRFTKDRKLVIFHDESCKRLLGIDKEIDDITYKEVMSSRILHNGRHSKNKVLSLEQFIELFPDFLYVYIDVKGANKNLADSLLLLINRYDIFDSALIADGNLLFLSYLKFKNPRIRTVLEGFNSKKEWMYYFMPKKFKPDYYASFLSKVDKKHIAFFKDKKLLKNKIVYGVNRSNISKVVELGLQNVIIDYDVSMGDYCNIENVLSNYDPR